MSAEVAFVRAPDKDSGRVFDLPHVAAVGAALLAVGKHCSSKFLTNLTERWNF